ERRDVDGVAGTRDLALIVPVDDTRLGVARLRAHVGEKLGGPDLGNEVADSHLATSFGYLPLSTSSSRPSFWAWTICSWDMDLSCSRVSCRFCDCLPLVP